MKIGKDGMLVLKQDDISVDELVWFARLLGVVEE